MRMNLADKVTSFVFGLFGVFAIALICVGAGAPNYSGPSNGGTPGGAAGGDLTGTYPNPSIGTGVIVNADVNASAAIAGSKLNFATTDATDTANVARLNAANTFTNTNTITGQRFTVYHPNAANIVFEADGTNQFVHTEYAFFASIIYAGDVAASLNGSYGVRVSNGKGITSTADGRADTAVDIGLFRNAAGKWEVNSGTSGEYREIISAGTRTTDNAAFGNLGEFIQSLVAVGSPVSLTNNTAANVTLISLSTGDWDVEGNANFSAAAATVTGTQGGISTTSATLPTDGSEVYSGVQVTILSEIDSVTLPRKRISATSTAHTGLTADAATDVITDTGNGYSNGDTLYFTAIAGGAGLAVNTMYYVINVATDSYKLSATQGGAAIDITTDITSGTIKKGVNVYLVAKSTFSAGTVSGFGQINARRVR